jgi:hypothetical protein
MIDMVQLNPCGFPGGYNPASGKSCQGSRDGFQELNKDYTNNASATTTDDVKEKPKDIYNSAYEMGSLAGSSGVAYQTSHRSPLSYNIDITKSSPMTELTFDTFERNSEGSSSKSGAGAGAGSGVNAREVIERHNANASAFYNPSLASSSETSEEGKNDDDGVVSLYNDIANRLSSLIERTNENTQGGDLSTIRGDTISQIYYYSITAVLLYLFYRILYKKRR